MFSSGSSVCLLYALISTAITIGSSLARECCFYIFFLPSIFHDIGMHACMASIQHLYLTCHECMCAYALHRMPGTERITT